MLLFKDFLHPVTILSALPLSLGGAFVGLLLAQKSFSMPSLIGLIMLMGVATKNSILLVEYAIVARRDHGLSRFDALLDACHKRARPIIMTTIAMGASTVEGGRGTAQPARPSRPASAMARRRWFMESFPDRVSLRIRVGAAVMRPRFPGKP